MNLTEEQIERILTSYKNKRVKENNYYHEVSKNQDDFKKKNRARAKEHYDKNKDKKKENYQKNKDLISAKNLYNYYQKKDKTEIFKEKHPLKWDMINNGEVLV